MSNWVYVAMAYIVVWGAVALYALALARRVTQASEVAHSLAESSQDESLEG